MQPSAARALSGALAAALVLLVGAAGAPPAPPPAGDDAVETNYCAFYNGSACAGDECAVRERCGPRESGKSNHCYVLWDTDARTGRTSARLKGCFVNTVACRDRPACTPHQARSELLVCCCEGDMCNERLAFPGRPAPAPAPAPSAAPAPAPAPPAALPAALVYSLAPLSVLALGALLLYLLYRRRKGAAFDELPTAEPSLSCPPSPGGGAGDEPRAPPVVLCEVRARGRFGAVWRAQLQAREVAVKVFPVQDKQSWLSEQEIFKLPRMAHPDVLQFIGVDKKGDNLLAEYWLITAYHEKGSLCDYLKAHQLSWAEAGRVAASAARGLAHLHDEASGAAGGAGFKPAVAHRDFKSKNVLLKSDMSACIADFGLALVFQPGQPCGDTHGQVGTRRYMAPEVLEGAINFTKDAFLRIDMYACGLVLWEIASRCSEGGAHEYRLPLEAEVGAHPSLEEMQDAVVLRKLRPRVPDAWRAHAGLAVLADTMEECWDHDAEARLSASCVLERVSHVAAALPSPATPLIPH